MLADIDIDKLRQFLGALKDNGVTSFRAHGFEVVMAATSASGEDKSPEPILTEDQQLPPDLRTDNINSTDALINWSASPLPDEPTLPGVGNEEL